jgi:hypothetical protein
MAVCEICHQEMHDADGCVRKPLHMEEGDFEPVRFGNETDPRWKEYAAKVARCGDCDAKPGNYHHLGCDIEECPRCAGQLISCECNDYPDEEGNRS